MTENTINHIIIDVVTGEQAVGGIKAFALRNRVQASYATLNLKLPSFAEINEAVFDLIANDTLELKNSFIRLSRDNGDWPKKKTALGAKPNKSWEPVSGLEPCGPGDTLFNSDGQPVAQIIGMRRLYRTDSSGTRRLHVVMDMEALFPNVMDKYGNSVPGEGEILSTAQKPDNSYDIEHYVADPRPSKAKEQVMKEVYDVTGIRSAYNKTVSWASGASKPTIK
jgi:hypothetical protein